MDTKIAYINSQVACAMIEAMGMQADNDYAKSIGEHPKWFKGDFDALMSKYGIHHNAVLTYLQE